MRAREFIREQTNLPVEDSDPMHYAYNLPGLSVSNPYQCYRFSTAIARARSEADDREHINPNMEEWTPQAAMGAFGVVVGATEKVTDLIDAALKMTDISGGKKPISTTNSEEPDLVNTTSPLPGFAGYNRKR